MREFADLKIAVAGTGCGRTFHCYAVDQHHHVAAVDIVPEKSYRGTDQQSEVSIQTNTLEISGRKRTGSDS